MRIFVYSILMVVGLSLLGACNPQPEAAELLRQAESLVDTHPDSAMRLIDSLFYPEKSLRREHYMRFLVTQVQAKYKTYRPIGEDTLIFLACDYFSVRDKDPRTTALAWFYSGCVHREREDYGKATQHYKEAETYAARTANPGLQGLIQYNLGDLFAVQDLYPNALESYKIAA
jgi:tetratricopeptide (TPR) repeat protein